MMLKIGLDLDDTICDFLGPYLKRFGTPKKDTDITKNVNRILIKDKKFWMSLPVINRPNFVPTLYCTKRVHPKTWSKQFLIENGIPSAPIYQILCQLSSKAPRIKGRVDVFIDDSISNFIDLNLKGVPCLLINNQHNQKWGPIGRIYSLDKEEIEECYHLFKDTLFSYFGEIVNDYRQKIPKQYRTYSLNGYSEVTKN